jgi:secretion/DNA translocation related TadE-like protein
MTPHGAADPAVAGRSTVDGERGSATVVGVGAVLALLTVFALAVHLGSAVITRHRAEAAADLAALAAAATTVGGTPQACARAQRVADRMATRITSCDVHGWEVSVQVEASPPGPLGRFGTARATARAGPAANRWAISGAFRRAVGGQR